MSAALPPLPAPKATHWETNQWGHAELTASDAYTADQMQDYATATRADLESENKRLREALTWISGQSMPMYGSYVYMIERLQEEASDALWEQP